MPLMISDGCGHPLTRSADPCCQLQLHTPRNLPTPAKWVWSASKQACREIVGRAYQGGVAYRGAVEGLLDAGPLVRAAKQDGQKATASGPREATAMDERTDLLYQQRHDLWHGAWKGQRSEVKGQVGKAGGVCNTHRVPSQACAPGSG